MSDQEIIDLVLQGDVELLDSANDKEELSKSISYREAHSAVQTTLMFLEQKRDNDIKVCKDDLLLMRRLLRNIKKEKIII